MQETQERQVPSLGPEDLLEEEMATHSSILAWEIPWTGSLLGYSPQGHKEMDITAQKTFLMSRNRKSLINKGPPGTSLVVQWLRFHAPNAAGPGLIPGQGTRSYMLQLKTLHAATKTQCGQISKKTTDILKTKQNKGPHELIP